jgi:hypothetical protein
VSRSKVDENREKLRNAARDKIKAEKLIMQLIENSEKLQTGAETDGGLTSNQIGAYKAANEVHFKLLNKVLPDVKAVELTDGDGNALPNTIQVTIVKSQYPDT